MPLASFEGCPFTDRNHRSVSALYVRKEAEKYISPRYASSGRCNSTHSSGTKQLGAMGAQQSEGNIWWTNVIFFTAAHIAALLGLWYRPPNMVSRATLVLAAIRWQIGQFG